MSLVFQFLIGTLKTQARWQIREERIAVSIPDRYSKNQARWQIREERIAVSIPDRYSKNHISPKSAYNKIKFQFLIGTLKTRRRGME